jgi:hypothetical protein
MILTMHRTFRSSEHLKGFSAVKLPSSKTMNSMEVWLSQFGPVKQSEFRILSDAFDYLFPVKTFTTRFLIIGLSKWSLLLADMREQNCYVDAYAISRATRCDAIGVTFRELSREMHIFEDGKHIRQLESADDGDRWYYWDTSPLQPFENVEETRRKRKKDRLSVSAVQQYFEAYTGLKIPDWKTLKPDLIYGLERSLHEILEPVRPFETIRDV